MLQSNGIRITAADIAGKTISEILAAKGFLRETPELIEAFDAATEVYFDWRGRYGAQFTGKGTGFRAEDPNASHRDTDWSRKDIIVLSTSGGEARLVNDEGVLSIVAGIALAATSVAVVYTVMMEFGFNKTDYGKTILAACFITDLGTVITLGLVFAPWLIASGIHVHDALDVIGAHLWDDRIALRSVARNYR